MKDKLVVVDKNDNFLKMEDKWECHEDNGILHRAFSIFIFNDKGELLVQKRSKFKKLWPLYQTNTCCSHPRKDESYVKAAERRLKEELGFSCPLKYLYKFMYNAKYKNIGSENELCAVLVGFTNAKTKPNPKEIADWKYVNVKELVEDMGKNPEKFTPWFKMELKKLLKDYRKELRLK